MQRDNIIFVVTSFDNNINWSDDKNIIDLNKIKLRKFIENGLRPLQCNFNRRYQRGYLDLHHSERSRTGGNLKPDMY